MASLADSRPYTPRVDNTRALAEVARSRGRALGAVARRWTRDPSRASDLVQDAFERAVRSAPALEPDDLHRWVLAAMRNLFIDGWRHQRVRAKSLHSLRGDSESVLAVASEVDPLWSQITSSDLEMALQQLAPPFRRIFERYVERVPLSQIAVEFGIPVATVGTRLFRARKKLRAILVRSSSLITGSESTERYACVYWEPNSKKKCIARQ